MRGENGGELRLFEKKGADEEVSRHCNGYSTRDASHGAFQKYTIVPQHAISELPYALTTSLGVVMPLAISTAAAGLYQHSYLHLPLPTTSKPKTLDRTLLVWGGSSSVGSCCIQLAVASGAEVFVTASERNFEFCRKLGAKRCFDYHDPEVEDRIVETLEERTVAGAYHANGGAEAFQACARILDRTKGKAIVVTVQGVPETGLPSSVRGKMSEFLSLPSCSLMAG